MTAITPTPARSLSAPSREIEVLVVEDELRWRELLVAVLPDMGFAATGVASAEEAFQLMSERSFDILLLDLHLPGMTGIDLFDRVRERWPRTQAVILTGYGELAAAQRAIRLRVAEFLTKPCHLHEIQSALERAAQLLGEAAVASPDNLRGSAETGLTQTLEEVEQQRIAEALARHNNNKSAAARELGISRRSLYDRLNQRR